MDPTQDPQQDPELELPEGQEDAQEEQQEPRYVTEDALEQIVNRAVEGAVRRINQSSRDRARHVDQEIASIKARLEKSNVNLTAEQEAGLRQQIEAETGEPQEGQQQDPDQTVLAQQVYQETMSIFQVERVEIKQTDPEWKIIARALQDPDGNLTKYRSQVYKAINAKRARIEEASENADARTLGEGGHSDPNDIRGIDDPAVLVRMGEERMRRRRT